jgi:hypothetical protein
VGEILGQQIFKVSKTNVLQIPVDLSELSEDEVPFNH